MKKRPFSIKLLSALFLLSPLGVLAELIYFYKIPIVHWTRAFMPELWTWQVIAFVVLTPFMGLVVWTVHRWAYIALIAFSALILVNNLAVWISGLGMSDLATRIILSVGLII